MCVFATCARKSCRSTDKGMPHSIVRGPGAKAKLPAETSALAAAVPMPEAYKALLREMGDISKAADPRRNPVAAAEQAWQSIIRSPSGCVCAERIDLLFLIAKEMYLAALPHRALPPAVMAVEESRALGDQVRLRRSLTTLSALYTETCNQPAAIENAAEGIRVAEGLGDNLGKSKLLNNTGLALMYSGQYEEAIDCFEVAIDNLDRKSEHSPFRITALGNIALACLNLDDLRAGLRAARRACDEPIDLENVVTIVDRCIVECHYVRLLLETGNVSKARERCGIVNELASRSASLKAKLFAEIAEG